MPPALAPLPDNVPRVRIACTINGESIVREAPVDCTLLTFLRDIVGLTGSKGACLEGECGSCTVLIDGTPVTSCLMLAAQADGRALTTIEGLADGNALDVLQDKFIETGAAQCGYCTPGLIMAARAVMQSNPRITEAELITALEGNICRCTGYASIIEAVRRAYRTLTP
ncbi:MAG TPA: (2Fe-2S)-binding protein [Phycisphaerae bacterium]|nr:(2Fe-2S)-binding protein [Phycisphaerae bacterium]